MRGLQRWLDLSRHGDTGEFLGEVSIKNPEPRGWRQYMQFLVRLRSSRFLAECPGYETGVHPLGTKYLPIVDAGYYTTAAEPLKVWVGRDDAANSDPAKTRKHYRLHFRGIQQATNQDMNSCFHFVV